MMHPTENRNPVSAQVPYGLGSPVRFLGMTRRTLWLIALLAPAILFMLFFAAYPVLTALTYSFFDWNGLTRGDFVGLAHFKVILFKTPYASYTYQALSHNFIVFISLMVLENGLAFLIAFALLKGLPGHRFHQVAVFLPVVLSTAIIGFLWKLLLHPLFGLVNQLLTTVGLTWLAQPWLGQQSTALASVIVVNAWHWIGFPALVFLAGMQRIPLEVIEAAKLDGCNDRTMMRKIIWPLIAPAATIVFVLTFIGSFNWFELPYIMTGMDGAPGGATDVLGLYFYRTAFGNFTAGIQDFGRGSALAVLLFLMIISVSIFWTRYMRQRELEL